MFEPGWYVSRRVLLAGLALLVAGTFAQVGWQDFVRLDTATYVIENPYVHRGLSRESLAWAFRPEGYAANWHPFTWLSHMVDCQMYGLGWPGGHKLTSVAWHLATTLLLFLALERLTCPLGSEVTSGSRADSSRSRGPQSDRRRGQSRRAESRRAAKKTDHSSGHERRAGQKRREPGVRREPRDKRDSDSAAHATMSTNAASTNAASTVSASAYSATTDSAARAARTRGSSAAAAGATRLRVQCAMVAALFAIHPLRAESVAWVAERKDVLAAFFWVLAMYAYARYAERPRWGSYLGVTAALVAGLLSKATVVTLPCALLLLDYWPLRRLHSDDGRRLNWRRVRLAILEKLPWLGLSAGASVMTWHAQAAGGALHSLHVLSPGDRLVNAVISYATYLGMMVWPAGLACFYPHPGSDLLSRPEAAMRFAASLGLLLAITGSAVWQIRRRPYLAVGWFWYLGTLVPMVGIVAVGRHALADRCTYIPMIGPLVAVVWLVGEWTAERTRIAAAAAEAAEAPAQSDIGARQSVESPRTAGLAGRQTVVLCAAVISIAICVVLTSLQLRHWRDTRAAFERALEVTEGNYLAYATVGLERFAAGEHGQALDDCRRAVAIASVPFTEQALGFVLGQMGQYDEAEQHLRRAASLHEHDWRPYSLLAPLLARQGRLDEAVESYRRALEIDADLPPIQFELATLYRAQGRLQLAREALRRAIALDPRSAIYELELAGVELDLDDPRAALAAVDRVMHLAPDTAGAYFLRGAAEDRLGRPERAAAAFREALRLAPDHLLATNNLAWLLATGPDELRDGAEAVRLAERACAANNRRPATLLDTLAAAYAEAGRYEEAIAAAQEALELARQHASPVSPDEAAAIERRLALYRSGRPYHQVP